MSEYLADPSIRLLVDFFQDKGVEALKQEDGREDWYQDWIDYQSHHGLYASLLSPQRYSSRAHKFDLRKLTRFLEVFAYFSPAHAYSLHVSFLGLSVILMSSNESLKKEAIAKLEAGGLFALAVSERTHGSDLLANEFAITEGDKLGFLADGEKFYIGNANSACIISVLARQTDGEHAVPMRHSSFVFFALRPKEGEGFQNLRKIRCLGIRSAFVGEFGVKHQTVAEGDIISEGHDAWDAVFATVNLGKFFLGFGAVGSCMHAFAEAFDHMNQRVLYGKQVTEIPHLRLATTVAFARLTAMKFYATRALDYLQASSAEDCRFLLFNSVQKARVSTEGVEVMRLLSECVGAWGFEAETYFELALRDTLLIPALESSTHINFGLTARFIDAYFADTKPSDVVSVAAIGSENPENNYWMKVRDHDVRKVQFAHCLHAYQSLAAVPNVGIFIQQVKEFSQFANLGTSALNPAGDPGLRVALGKCFSIITYAQLVAENCEMVQASPELISVIFHSLIEDLSQEALLSAAMFPAASEPRIQLKNMARVPRTVATDFEQVFGLIAARYRNSGTN